MDQVVIFRINHHTCVIRLLLVEDGRARHALSHLTPRGVLRIPKLVTNPNIGPLIRLSHHFIVRLVADALRWLGNLLGNHVSEDRVTAVNATTATTQPR